MQKGKLKRKHAEAQVDKSKWFEVSVGSKKQRVHYFCWNGRTAQKEE